MAAPMDVLTIIPRLGAGFTRYNSFFQASTVAIMNYNETGIIMQGFCVVGAPDI